MLNLISASYPLSQNLVHFDRISVYIAKSHPIAYIIIISRRSSSYLAASRLISPNIVLYSRISSLYRTISSPVIPPRTSHEHSTDINQAVNVYSNPLLDPRPILEEESAILLPIRDINNEKTA